MKLIQFIHLFPHSSVNTWFSGMETDHPLIRCMRLFHHLNDLFQYHFGTVMDLTVFFCIKPNTHIFYAEIFYFAISAYSIRITFSISPGDVSICRPIRPPLKKIFSRFFALKSKTVLKNFFMPTGEQPPWM